MGRGAFLVLEGGDHAGKSTQVKKLVETLKSRGTVVSAVNFPDRSTSIGKTIDSYLKGNSEIDDAVVHLLFSANRWEVAKSIRDRLASGETIVADRYAFSGVAYTAAKGKMRFFVKQEVAKQRGNFGGERYETPEFQEEVRRKFDLLRYEDLRQWELIDASKSIDEVQLFHTRGVIHWSEGAVNKVAALVESAAMRTIAQVQLLPVKDLWVDADPVPAVTMGFAGMGFGRTSS